MKHTSAILAVCLLAYVSTGLYFVQPDEQVVVRRFGRMVPTLREPGPHFGLPWGLDRVDRVKPREVKRVTIGPFGWGVSAAGSLPAQFLTGDRNLVNAKATVHYTIHDPAQYLFRSSQSDPMVAIAAEATLTQVLSGQPVDDALTFGKQSLGIAARDRLQKLIDPYRLGITIVSVDIGTVEPPAEVAEAFADVISAMRERQQQENHAHSYTNRTLAQARADARRIRDNARAYRTRTIWEAEGNAQRFELLLAEYVRAPDLTARRLYLETMAQTLPNLRSKLIIDPESQLDVSILRAEQP